MTHLIVPIGPIPQPDADKIGSTPSILLIQIKPAGSGNSLLGLALSANVLVGLKVRCEWIGTFRQITPPFAGAQAGPISILIEIAFLVLVAILHNRLPGIAGTLGLLRCCDAGGELSSCRSVEL
jgi:hypothetical protein